MEKNRLFWLKVFYYTFPILVFVFSYLLFAFFGWSLNPMDWWAINSWFGRVLLFIWFIWCINGFIVFYNGDIDI